MGKINAYNPSTVIFLYFALKPLYLWSSGTLQICDFIFLIGFFFYIISNKGIISVSRRGYSIINFLFFIIVYQCTVNFLWYVYLQDFSVIKPSLYYIFNFFMFFFCLSVSEKYGIEIVKNVMAKGCFISIIITIIGLIVFTGSERSTGFFNNPNQLGYYGVIVLTIMLYCSDYLSKFMKIIIIVGAFWAIIASLSKAGILAAFGLLIFYLLFFKKEKDKKKLFVRILLITIVFLAIYFLFYSNIEIVTENVVLSKMRYRIFHMSEENDSNLGEGRGYNRVFEMGIHFLWGMGEGSYGRFTVKQGSEIHSSFVSILVSYGIIGFFAYLVFFIKCLKQNGLIIRNISLMIGIALYSFTHNGIRNTLLWMLLAVLFVDCQNIDNFEKTDD